MKTAQVRLRRLSVSIAIMLTVAALGLLVGCSLTSGRGRPDGSSPGVTPSKATAASTARAMALGKRIYETDNDNLGHITTMYGIPRIKINTCRNCHGSDAKGGGNLPGPDIRGVALQPKYDEATFARVLTEGLDSTGKRLSKKMPLFYVTPAPEDAPALWLYLNSLK